MNDANQKELEKLGVDCINHLKSESALLADLVTVSNSIRELLGRYDNATSETLLGEQERLQSALRQMEVHRTSLRERIARTLDIPIDQSKISEVQKRVPASMRDRIESLRSDIHESVEKIQSLTRINTLLLQQSVDIYERLLLAVSGGAPESQVYSPHGQLNQGLSGNVVQTKC